MAEGRQWDEWDRFSVLIAKIHNVNCVRKKDTILPRDVHPFMRAKVIPASKANFQMLRVLVKTGV
jgi:hypothetical protein